MSYWISICTNPAQIRAAFPEVAPWDGSITPRVVAPDGTSVAMVHLDHDQTHAAAQFTAVLSLYPTRAAAFAARPDLYEQIRTVSTISNSEMDELPDLRPPEQEPQ